MKLVSTLVVLTLASAIATSSQRDEKYSLHPKLNGPVPKKFAYGFEFNFELNPEVEDMDKSFSITGSIHATQIDHSDGAFTRRFAYKFSEMNKPLAPNAKELITEVSFDKEGNEIKRIAVDPSPSSHMACFMTFDAPSQQVAIGEVWTANLDSRSDGLSTTFGAAQLAGIELVEGTKCFRVEQVFREPGPEAKPTLSTIWIRVRDGVVFKEQWSGSFLPIKIEGTSVTAKATLKLLEG